ncbi:MAG: hypothetical protein ABFS45_02330 [Pseudomonadota bacterium]
MSQPTADKSGWPDFPFMFVKYGQYSPQMNEKSGSASLALATVAILGQPPSNSPVYTVYRTTISRVEDGKEVFRPQIEQDGRVFCHTGQYRQFLLGRRVRDETMRTESKETRS